MLGSSCNPLAGLYRRGRPQLVLFEQYARDGDNADLKAWAAKTLPHLKEHLAMAKRLS